MSYYITYGQFQKALNEHFEKSHMPLEVPEMAKLLYKKGAFSNTYTLDPYNRSYTDLANVSEEDFQKAIDKLYINFDVILNDGSLSNVYEDNIIPVSRNAFVIRTFCHTRHKPHKHDYFEINFCLKGQAHFYFENEHRIMKESELVIIAPNSTHDTIIDEPGTLLYTLCLRSSTFNNCFFSLMSRKDLLSYFFRTILQGDTHPNYLFFYTMDSASINYCFRHLFMESHMEDQYFNTCAISYVNILFATLLRTYSDTVQFYDYKLGTDFSLVLQYIQNNYQNLTLSGLAELFHYSEPHLCTLIKQNTGMTFTALIKNLRLAEAKDYLTHSDLKINEIAERVGYNSADHFSRVFRNTYKISPVEYRKQNAVDVKPLIPFAEIK